MTDAVSLSADWLLADPGSTPAVQNARVHISSGKISLIDGASGATGQIAVPALANAHDHGRAFRPASYGAADQPLETWLPALMRAPDADLYTQCVVAFGRLALSGVASILHMHIPQGGDPVDEAKTVARAAADVGVRLGYAVPVVDANPFVYGGAEALCGYHDSADWAIVRHWDGRPAPARAQLDAVAAIASACESRMVSVQYGPAGPQWVTEAGWRDLADRAAADKRRIHTHLLETQTQRAWADAHFPGGLVPWFDERGLLTDRLTVTHGVWLSDAEIDTLAARGVTVAVNTSSNLRLRSGMAPVRRFAKAGLAFALGLDGMAFDNDEDMLRELRLFHALHAPIGLDGAGIDIGHAWRAATTNGRKVIDGVDDEGLLEAGRDADILILDWAALASDAAADRAAPLDLLMTRARREHVRALYVAGRPVVVDGSLTGVDFDAAVTELRAASVHAAPRDATERDVLSRHQDAMRHYYADGRHLDRSGIKNGR